MENKYYTPKLEEFYIGFEFESNYILFQKHLGDSWTKTTLSDEHNWFYDSYVNDAVPSEFRVKYLDRKDIESLGFKYYKTHIGTTTLEFEGDKCDIAFDSEFSKYWNITITDNEDINFTYFHGYIKNKSELKKLLKQLNIK